MLFLFQVFINSIGNTFPLVTVGYLIYNIIHLGYDIFGFPERRLDVDRLLSTELVFDVQLASLADGELEVSLVIYDSGTLDESLEHLLVVVEDGGVNNVINIFHKSFYHYNPGGPV